MFKWLVTLMLGTLLAVMPAMAQEQAQELNIPGKVVTPNLAPWIAVGVMVFLIVIVGAGAFKGSKRSHRD